MELQRLHCECGIDLVDVARMTYEDEDKGKAISLAREVESKCAGLSDDRIHGMSLVGLGFALTSAKQMQQALEHLNRALIMLKGMKNPPNLLPVYHAVSHTHYCEGRLPEALDSVQEAWKLAESGSNTSYQAIVALSASLIYFSADRDTEAWKHAEIALMKASHVGDRLYIARALEAMGYGYLRRGDFENAYGAYDAAAEEYHASLNDIAETRCKDNRAKIKEKQENPVAEIGFQWHGMDPAVDESLFYPPIQPSRGDDIPISDS
jgi:tetratricopeptide (TPR) repeat protein